jgi:hypothetical protein
MYLRERHVSEESCLSHPDLIVSQTINRQKQVAASFLSVSDDFICCLSFYPEDGGSALLWNIWLYPDYTALQLGRLWVWGCYCHNIFFSVYFISLLLHFSVIRPSSVGGMHNTDPANNSGSVVKLVFFFHIMYFPLKMIEWPKHVAEEK